MTRRGKRPTTRPTTGSHTTTGNFRRKRNRKTTQRQRVPVVVRWHGLLSRVVGLFALGGLAAGGYYGWQALLHSPRLQVKEIRILGTERTHPAEVIAHAGVREGQPILGLDLDAMALSIRRHPWVREARVLRKLPNELRIEVEEFIPTIAVALGDLYLADSEGTVFKRVAADDGLVFPVVTGLALEGNALGDEGSARLVDAVALTKSLALSSETLGRVDELHWDKDLGWSVVFVPEVRKGKQAHAYRVHLGMEPVGRIGLAEKALTRLKSSGREPAVIWADGTHHTDRVHVRLQRGSAPEPDPEPLIANAR